MQADGWVKVHRKMLENPVVCKDKDYFSVWMYLLLNATHKDMQVMFGGEKITLLPGQLLTSRNAIAKALKIDPSKVKRILNCFKIEQQIDQRTDRQKTLISIENWGIYQCDNDQRNDQRLTNEARKKDEKEKRSKKEKEENKERDKNERSCNARTCEDDNDDLLSTEIRLFSWRDTKVLMLSEVQFDSICEQCGLDEIDYYMDRMVELVSKGYKFGCSHYEYILQMVDKDRRVRNETVP